MDKIKEATRSVMPLILIVLGLTLFLVPISTDLLLSFLVGAVLVVVGMGLFTLGADIAMSPIGSRISATLTKSRNVKLILLVSFLLGVSITIAEPDLQVLAETVPHIDNAVLLITVGVGVGLFLALSMLRVILGWSLRWILIISYGIVFVLAILVDRDFLSVAFDSGGVTTGPMTVPFILALGIGMSNIRSDDKAESDSFGLVALCSIGPILMVLILSFFYGSSSSTVQASISTWKDTTHIGMAYIEGIPTYMGEMLLSLAPIFIIFLLFQVVSFRLSWRNFMTILMGILYTYIGLVLFLTGVNVGFSSLGTVIGMKIAEEWPMWAMIGLAAVLGWFIISAEPAVAILENQIETVSAGAIPGKAVKLSLSIAIAIAMGLSMLRVVTGISILWFLLPGYALAILLSFFVPDIYTAIAFDSGGVASGPMTATFLLQLMIGACSALGGNILKDAFGVVALVAMMPLISIQVMGVVYGRKKPEPVQEIAMPYGDLDIIELWGDES